MGLTERELIAWAAEALGRPVTGLSPLSKGGSDRRFFRLAPAGAGILVAYGAEKTENGYYTAIARFLEGIGIRVPAILADAPGQGLSLLEDLGDTDLWAMRNASWDCRRDLYEKTLAEAARLHGFPTASLPADLPLTPGFDAALYRWEREYFRERFVEGVCGIVLNGPETTALEAELKALAERLAAGPQSLVHRDFQSQNIMIVEERPVLIDFQGMRVGNPLYDAASLLYDPYVSFKPDERDFLLGRYRQLALPDMAPADFEAGLRDAAAQRLLQALGAYGFLGMVKGKKAFLEHVPAGLANLRAATAGRADLARLAILAERCTERFLG